MRILFLTKVLFTSLNGLNTQTSDKTCILRQEIRQRMSECGSEASRARGQDDPGLLNFGSRKESHRFKAAIRYPLKIAPSIQCL